MMDEALAAFLAESHEALGRLESDLVTVEQNPGDAAVVANIFRAIHTIKGTCGFFGFPRLEKLTHVAEDALSLLRDGRIALSFDMVNSLLALVDAVRIMLVQIEDTGRDGDNDYPDLVAAFIRHAGGAAPVAAVAVPAPAAGAEADRALDEIERSAVTVDGSIRVGVGLLDKLMNVVGELVLARNRILQHAGNIGDAALVRASNRLNIVTTELQEGLMQTRMQPVSVLWSSFPRLVRDLEVQTGKSVRLEREGDGTEVDRTLLQAIRDPLTHLIRNAVDHGIEAPATRVAAGKPAQGVLRLRAFHESGYVIVEVIDDGAGINTAAVLQRALDRGLVRAEQAARLGERDILGFLFAPGFSTAAQVTSISGRGVGLDVVRTNIEQVGGAVEIETKAGAGTVFRLKVPLTLAIIQALVVGCQHERFAVPQMNLLEIVRVDGDSGALKIEVLHGVPLLRLRGQLLPLVDLRAFLGLPTRAHADDPVYVLVLEVDRRQYGLIVDAVHDAEEIVVKPMGRQLKAVTAFAGATIMGDGRVALILDVKAIARLSQVLAEERRGADGGDIRQHLVANIDERHALLLFNLGDRGRAALPLSAVARLEEIPASAVEYSAGREVVQYRGQILPLLHLRDWLGLDRAETGETLCVVVHQASDGVVGLVVDHIVDIVEHEIDSIQRKQSVPGVLGSTIVQNAVTDIVDLEQILAGMQAELLRAPGKFTVAEASHG